MEELAYRQIHLDFHTSPAVPVVGEDFNPAEFVDTLKKPVCNPLIFLQSVITECAIILRKWAKFIRDLTETFGRNVNCITCSRHTSPHLFPHRLGGSGRREYELVRGKR